MARLDEMQRIAKQHKKYSNLKKVFVTFACLVVFVTTYMLVLPALTMESELVCNKGEHKHDSSCYSVSKELVCDKEEREGHKHSSSCYKTEKVLTCTDESPDHSHNDSCYKEDKKLICDKEESEGHKHGDSCYKEKKELTCDKDEHTHGDSCYKKKEEATTQNSEKASEASTEVAPEATTEEIAADFKVSATSQDGIKVTVSGKSEVLPCKPDEVKVTIKHIKNADQVEAAESMVEKAYNPADNQKIEADVYDVTLWQGEKEIEPNGKVSVLFSHVDMDQDGQMKVYHIKDGASKADDMDASVDKGDGEVKFTTDHFSEYVLVNITEENKAEEAKVQPKAEDSRLAKVAIETEEESQNGALDFSSYVTEVKIEAADEEWSEFDEYTKGTDGKYHIPDGKKVLKIGLKYTIPARTLSEANPTVTCNLGLNLLRGDSGKVKDSAGNECGTYTVDDKGNLSITFNDEFVSKNKNGSAIVGTFTFKSTVSQIVKPEDTEGEWKLSDSLDITIHVDGKKVITDDFKVQKSGIENNGDGTITYTATVTSKNGTKGKPVHIYDTMSDNILLNNNIVVTKSGKNVSVNPTIKNDGFDITLPSMNAGEVYTIQYTAKVKDQFINQDITANNTMTAEHEGEDGRIYTSTDSCQNQIKGKRIDKTGKLENDGSITWTLIVNQRGTDIVGKEVTDNMFSQMKNGSLTVSPSIGWQRTSNGIRFTAVKDGKNTNTYTITYKTEADPQIGQETKVKNTADFDGGSDDAEVGVPGIAILDKKANGYTSDTDGTVTLNWTLTIDTTKSALTGPWNIIDYSDAYYTKAQLVEIKNAIEQKIGLTGRMYAKEARDHDVNENNANYKLENLDSSKKYQTFKIIFNDTLPKGHTYTINYSSFVKPDFNVEKSYYNKAMINGKGTVQAKFTFYPTIKKEDYTGHESKDASGKKYHQYTVLDDKTLSWRLKVTVPEGASGTWTIVDHLPEGLDFVDVQPVSHHKAFTVRQNGNDISIIMNLSDYPAESYRFMVRAKIREDLPVGEVRQYNNTVQVYDKDHNEIGFSSNEQEVRNEDTTETIGKVGVQDDEIIKYNVTINPRKVVTAEDKSYHLEDKLKYYSSWDTDKAKAWHLSLVPGSFKVKVKSTGQALDPDLYTFRYEESNDQHNNNEYRTIIMDIDTDEVLEIEYAYVFSGNLIYSQQPVSNTVSLTNSGKTDTGEEHKIEYYRVDSGATGDVEGAKIYKVDKDNMGIFLEGAEFKLSEYNGREYVVKKVDGKDTAATDTNGCINYEDLTFNTAYKLEEVVAPKGYKLDTTPHYFIINNTNTTTYPVKKPADFSGEVTSPGAANIYVTDEKLPYTTYEVKKEWDLPEGVNAPESITFELKQNDTVIATYTLTKDGMTLAEDKGLPEDVTCEYTGEWAGIIKNLPKKDANSRTYVYSANEIQIAGQTDMNNYDVSYDTAITDKVTITNKLKTTSINMKKEWVGLEEGKTPPTSITFDVMNGTQKVVTFKLTEERVTAVGTVPAGITASSTGSWAAKVEGLPFGYSYSVKETFIGEDPGTPVVVKEDKTEEAGAYKVTYRTDEDGTLVIVNEEIQYYELPHTGGMGTTPFTISGLALLGIAGGMMIYKKRSEEE